MKAEPLKYLFLGVFNATFIFFAVGAFKFYTAQAVAAAICTAIVLLTCYATRKVQL